MSYEASKTVVSRVHFSNKLLLIGAAIAVLGAFSTPLLNAQTPVAPQITYRWETTVFSTTNFPVPTIAVDTSGNVYIANDAIAIKEILQPDGGYVVSVVATGLNYPEGIAVDAGGNVYIADTFNERILKASRNPDGSYSLPTEVVSGLSVWPDGVAVDASGNLYFTSCSEWQVYKLASGSATPQLIGQGSDGFNCPRGIAVDGSGNLYIANQDGKNVMKETRNATTGAYSVSTISPPAPGLNAPMGIAVDASGNNIYVADDAKVVRETWSGSGYTQTTLADNGTELVGNPSAVALDLNGNIYIGDSSFDATTPGSGYGAVVKETLSGVGPSVGSVPLGTTGPASFLTLLFNSDVTLNADSPYKILTEGVPDEDFYDVSETIPSAQCAANPAYSAGQYCLVSPAFKPTLTGTLRGAVVFYDSTGAPLITAYMYGTGKGAEVAFSPAMETPTELDLEGIQRVAVDVNANIYTSSTTGGASYVLMNGSTPIGTFTNADGIAVDGGGNLYVLELGTNPLAVVKETLLLNGTYAPSVIDEEKYIFHGIAVDGSGNVFLAGGMGSVYQLTPNFDGAYSKSSITTGVGLAPNAITVDGSGNLYIADTFGHRVLKETLSPSGYKESVVADGNSSPYPLKSPWDVAVDGNGNLYVLDSDYPVVLKETPSGAGLYVQSLIADDSPSYGLSIPTGIAVDGLGNIYVADYDLSEVLEEDINSPPVLNFGTVNAGGTSPAQSVLVISNGNQTLTGTVTGLDVAGDFIQVSSSGTPADCSTTFSLIPGAACNLSIEFTPVSAKSGRLYGTATLTDNDMNGEAPPQVITLTGTVQVANGAPAITSANSTTFTAGTPGTFTVVATGTPKPAFSESGELPTGVSFNTSTGVLSGTPASGTGGSYNITFTAKNEVMPDATQSFTLTVDEAPAITSGNSTTFTVGTNGTFTVTATGTPTPTLSESGALPSGVTLVDNKDGTAMLSGTPALGTGASYAITITASNGVGTDATQSFTLTVDQAPAFTSTNSTTFAVGTAGTFTVAASGHPAPTFSKTGALPSGVTLDSTTGVLGGTPASGTGGSYPIIITASNGIGTDATQNFTLTVNEAPAITSGNSTTFTVGTLGSFNVTATGDPSPTLSTTSTLPSGVTFSGGVLSGTPAAGTGGSYAITFKASNSVNPDATQNFTLTVNQAPAITTAASTTFTVGSAGSFSVTATGYPAPTLSESGALPGGVTFNALTGVLSGTPAAGTGGSYAITFKASNGIGSNVTQNFTLTVNQAPTITSANSTTFMAAAAGTFTVTASGYPTASLSESGALPSGVSFVNNSNGTATLAGTPASGTAGSYPITITATNGVSPNATQNFTLTVQNATGTITLSPASMPAGTVGVSYRQTVMASGGTAPYRFTVSSGTLPSRLSLTSAGVLSGLPVAIGSFGFTIKATDAKGTTGSHDYTLVINPPVILLSPNTLLTGTAGKSYGQILMASGGIAPYTYTVSSGTLPSGLSLMKAGVLWGTPAASGSFNFTIKATDSNNFTGSRAYTLFINPPTIAISPMSLPAGTVGRSYRQTLTASGGIAPYTYTVSSGALPSGLSLTKSGVLSGTPTVSGSFTFTITATDSSTGGPYIGSKSYSLVVNKARP